MANCMYGNGVHEPSLERALELEDPEADVPFQFRASAVHMITQAWTGRLDQAHREAIHLRELCMERGCENDMMAVAGHTTMIDVWRGNFADAAVAAEETMERAEQIGAGHLRVIALTVRAKVAAYTGRTAEACDDARAAMDIAISCGSPQFAGGALMVLGFVEVSTGKYSEALATLQPLVDTFDAVPGSEIMRLWLLATGARCRSMWLAGQGDVDEAMRVANIAMSEHDRLPMPFERARTQLVLGALQRRQRLKQAAAQTFGEALGQFERMGLPLWAQRARDELDRTRVGPSRSSILTPTEQRIADLATSGMSNRDIATTLFISLKTVEANLTQVYRKLGIRSRAQLAQRLRNTQP
jgi:DNA-binding CsgD family transcriptional regulator